MIGPSAVSAVLAVATVLIGVAMLVVTFSARGGALTTGLLLGLLFVVGGGLRLYVLVKARQP
jgi:hypothetical protein